MAIQVLGGLLSKEKKNSPSYYLLGSTAGDSECSQGGCKALMACIEACHSTNDYKSSSDTVALESVRNRIRIECFPAIINHIIEPSSNKGTKRSNQYAPLST